jgi:hypothetical protein
VVPAAVVVLTVVVLGPALVPGYVLVGDMVFVPDQVLLPWMLGAGAGLPRSVPQDAVIAALTGPVPGWIWEKAALVGALLLLGTGVARLVRPAGRGAALVAAVVAVWSAYVGERLLLGHWSLLLAVGVLPWAVHLAVQVRRGVPGAGARWLLLIGLASLTPSGGVLVLATTAPVVLVRGPGGVARRVGLVGAAAVLQLPWLLPALLHPGAGSVAGADVFAARAEGPWGVLLTTLTTGGAWNADAVPESRSSWWGLVVSLLVVLVAAAGARRVPAVLGRAATGSLAAMSALGLLWCAAGSWSVTAPVAQWVVASVPGAGLLRDAQKWLAPWLVLLAVCAGVGAAVIATAAAGRARDPLARRAVLVLALVLPVVALPDLALGIAGRLTAVDYPEDLARVRAALQAAPPGDVVSLPWSTFRAFPWNNGGRTVLDPVPRFMGRTVVASTDLAVGRGEDVVVVPGDDPRAATITAAVESGADLAGVLASLGIRYAVVARDLPGGPGPVPAGATVVVPGTSFELVSLPGPAASPPDRSPVAGGVGLAAALTVLVLAAVRASAARRTGRSG